MRRKKSQHGFYKFKFGVIEYPVETGSASPESAIAPQTNSAAAELDHFSLREKIGTRTVLAESPEFVCGAKHGLIDSGEALAVPTSDLQASDCIALFSGSSPEIDIRRRRYLFDLL